jgi:hypothetical protein
MNEAPFQLNFKTPNGTLINIRATTPAELDDQMDAIIQRATDIADLEGHIGVVSTLSNAGLKPQPVMPVAQQQYAAAQPAQPAPAGASPMCDHGLPMRLVPAGISKAGKPYKSFYACPNPRETACSAKA